MTLERHVVDTIKEWELKMGSLDSDIRLYYPKSSLCRYLNVSIDIDNELMSKKLEQYFSDNVKYLGHVGVSAGKDRFCILIGQEGCEYLKKNVQAPTFLKGLLNTLKEQKMQNILNFCQDYAKEHKTNICIQKEGETETIISFENKDVEPYVYCIDQNEFGITYHRFTRDEYKEL